MYFNDIHFIADTIFISYYSYYLDINMIDRFNINDIIIKANNLEKRDLKYAKCQKRSEL